jgi:hypothetical protein
MLGLGAQMWFEEVAGREFCQLFAGKGALDYDKIKTFSSKK